MYLPISYQFDFTDRRILRLCPMDTSDQGRFVRPIMRPACRAMGLAGRISLGAKACTIRSVISPTMPMQRTCVFTFNLTGFQPVACESQQKRVTSRRQRPYFFFVFHVRFAISVWISDEGDRAQGRRADETSPFQETEDVIECVGFAQALQILRELQNSLDVKPPEARIPQGCLAGKRGNWRLPAISTRNTGEIGNRNRASKTGPTDFERVRALGRTGILAFESVRQFDAGDAIMRQVALVDGAAGSVGPHRPRHLDDAVLVSLANTEENLCPPQVNVVDALAATLAKRRSSRRLR